MTTSNGKNEQTAVTKEWDGRYPHKQAFQSLAVTKRGEHQRLVEGGFPLRTDGFDIDVMVETLEKKADIETDKREKKNLQALVSRLISVADLSPSLYNRFSDNPNSLLNWFNPLQKGLMQAKSSLKTPQTRGVRLPIELAQFMRIDYVDTSRKDRDVFNQLVFDALKLEEDKTYFIKTGTFSSKFQFANAKCNEPLEMGEYFQVINNFAMQVGAGHSVDIVAREYIEDSENNPTIYNGMPLRTEFRAFVDFDSDEIFGIVPYWHPIVMKRALKHNLSPSSQEDFKTYVAHEDVLRENYNTYVNHVKKSLLDVIPYIALDGRYSVDIMKDGEDFYVIDMALMDESALVDQLPDFTLEKLRERQLID